MRAQMVSELIGALIEGAVGDLLALEDGGDGIGGPRGLRLEQLVEAALPRIVGVGGVPINQYLVALGVRQERQFRDAPRRVRDDAFQQRAEVADHADDGGRVKEVRTVLDTTLDAVAGVVEFDGEIELRRADADIHHAGGPRHVERRARRFAV